MDARITRVVLVAALLLVSMGARYRSANFIVETADPRLAQQFCQAAEQYRHDLAVEWVGEPMPDWSQPCPVTVMLGKNLGAGGATTFVFDNGEVFGWRMNIQGSAERVLDSVLPHEITHMIYASHFRQPLPRWADEGGATSMEHISERTKHYKMLNEFLRTGRGIAFSRMFAMKDYPADIMPLYAQGYSLAEFLIQTGGRRKYVEFLDDGLKAGDWSGAIAQNYGIGDLSQLQNTWLAWVKQGTPNLRQRNVQPGAATSPELVTANNRQPPVTAASYSQLQPAKNSIESLPVSSGRMVLVPDLQTNKANAADNSRTAGDSAAGQNNTQLASAATTMPANAWRNINSPDQSPAAQMNPAQRQDSPATDPNMVPVPSRDPFQLASANMVEKPNAPPTANEQAVTVQTDVSRPQEMEHPRQVILQWQR